jgi:hypothetical protein
LTLDRFGHLQRHILGRPAGSVGASQKVGFEDLKILDRLDQPRDRICRLGWKKLNRQTDTARLKKMSQSHEPKSLRILMNNRSGTHSKSNKKSCLPIQVKIPIGFPVSPDESEGGGSSRRASGGRVVDLMGSPG